jgi:3-oxoacyl-(acyl-carrier-protein) synthase
VEDYVIGTFTRSFLRDEMELASLFPLRIVNDDSYKSQSGYTFAASGLLEIVHLIKKNFKRSTMINSFGYGGQNASVIINPSPHWAAGRTCYEKGM